MEIDQRIKDAAHELLDNMQINIDKYGVRDGQVQILIDHLSLIREIRESFTGPLTTAEETSDPTVMMMLYLGGLKK